MLDERLGTDEATAPASPGRARHRLGVDVTYWTLSVLVLCGITTWLYGPHVFDGTSILNRPDFDWAQEVWFLGWPAYALQHGLNPLYSTWMNYPSGLNLMENTSMPLLGIVFAPITWLAGPVVTYSLVLRLGMLTSACSAQWVGRRLGLSRPSSFLAGLLYAFSAIEIVEGNGHAFLTFVPLPPLIGYAVYAAAAGRLRARRAGVVAGLLLGAQALISLEVALLTAVACVVGLVVAGVCYPRAVTRARVATLASGAAWALGVLAAVLVAPLLSYFGRGHFWGPAHADQTIFRANLRSVVVPGRFTWLSPIGVHLPHAIVFVRENGAYLGILVVAVLVAVAIRGWRVPLVRIATVTLLVLLVLSLGDRLNVTGSVTGVPLPFALLAKLPFMDALSPVRFFIVIGLLVGLLCAWGLDRAMAWARTGDAPVRPFGWVRAAVVALGALAVCLSLAPARAYPTSPTNVPGWLDSARGRTLVPDGAVVLFYPYPSLVDNQPMLFQAADGFRYKIIGGRGIVKTSRSNRHAIGPLSPYELPAVFLRASTGELATPPSATFFALPPLPPHDAATVRQFRTFATVNGVTAIVVNDATAPGARLAIAYLTDAFGAPALVASGSIAVWPRASLGAGSSASAATGHR
ncbi:MAG TPA: hypothetical protein VGZ03_00505 [Acidimicrobiales bacterium]|nr:hypothetical protein [Acidimicrobiales bacterium]